MRSFPPDASVRGEYFVSILKPLCGLDDGLEENLASFATLRGVRYEVICSVARRDDPALQVLERVRFNHPFAPFRVVLGGDPHLEHFNRKVARLVAAERVARGNILLISDSNVRMRADDLVTTMAAFSDPSAGCVSNLFTGAGARTTGAKLESLHLLNFVLPGNVIAAFASVPCVVGKSMAIRRDVLRAIGGFSAFSNVLAEDQAMALAIRKAGHRIVLSPVVIKNVVMDRSVRRALDRQIRWNKIRYAMSKRCYAAEFLLFPLPLAMLAALAGVLTGSSHAPLIVLAMLCLRLLQVSALARAAETDPWLSHVPLLDILQFCVQFVSLFDDRVNWRGHQVRIGPHSVMMSDESIAAGACTA